MADSRIYRVRRVVAAVPPAGDSVSLLRLAAHAAQMWQAELSAVLVEDRDLAQLAHLSVARHYVAATARPMPLTQDFLRLAQSAARSRAENLLARLLESTRVSWHLHDTGAAPHVLAEDDLLLVCPHADRAGDWLRTALDGPVAVAALLLDGAGRSLRELAIVHDGSPAGVRALALAARLAGDTGASCQVLLLQDMQRALLPDISAALGAAAIRFSIEPLAEADAATIAVALRHSRAGLVLLPATAESVCRLQGFLAEDT